MALRRESRVHIASQSIARLSSLLESKATIPVVDAEGVVCCWNRSLLLLIDETGPAADSRCRIASIENLAGDSMQTLMDE